MLDNPFVPEAGIGINIAESTINVDEGFTFVWTDEHEFQATTYLSSLHPRLTDTFDLGTSTLLWRKAYISEIDAVLFAEQTISLVGGWLIIGHDQGTIAADVAVGDNWIDFGKAMTPNDYVVLRASGSVEYVRVQANIGGTTYNVTRNLGGSGLNAWPAGSPFLVLGQSGNGRIELNAYDTPRISIITQGVTYNAQIEVARLGDLNGNWGYVAPTYGVALGRYGAGRVNLTADADNGIRVRNHTTTVGQWATDGTITFGEVDTDKPNIVITPSSMALRNFTTEKIVLSSDGTSYFADVMSLGPLGGIWQGTGTFAAPTTGLKLYRSGDVGLLEFWGDGAKQVYMGTDGGLYAGQGNVRIDDTGIRLSAGQDEWNEISWYNNATFAGKVYFDHADIGSYFMALGGHMLNVPSVGNSWGINGLEIRVIPPDMVEYNTAVDVITYRSNPLLSSITGRVANKQVFNVGYGYMELGEYNALAPYATSGVLRLKNTAWIAARNAGKSADINMIRVNASDLIELGTLASLAVDSSTVVANLNASYLEGYQAAEFALAGHGHTHASIAGIGADDHHDQAHTITGADHSAVGAAFAVVGLSAANTLGILTPLSNVTGATKEAILKSDSSGYLFLVRAYASVFNGGVFQQLDQNIHTVVLQTNAFEDAGNRFYLTNTGYMAWRDGSGGIGSDDCTLFRMAAAMLGMDGGLTIAKGLDLGSGVGAGVGSIVASGSVTASVGFQTVNASVRILRDNATNYGLTVKLTADAEQRLVIQADGKLLWGSGASATLDTNLYREAADKLRTDDTFISARIGINNTAPGAKLSITNTSGDYGSSNEYLSLFYGASKMLSVWLTSTWGIVIDNPHSDGDILLRVQGATRFEIDKNGLGFFATAPVAQQTITALSMAVGTGDDTVADVGSSFNQTTLNNNFRDLVNKVNAFRTALRNYGLLA